MHVHVAGGDERQTAGETQLMQALELRAVVGPAQELDRDPRLLLETGCDTLRDGGIRRLTGYPQHEAGAGAALDVAPVELVTAFRAAPPRRGDQLRQIAVRLAIGGEQHEFQAIGEPELGADEQFQLVFFGCNVCAHYPRERAFVGDGKRRVTKLGGALDEFLRARSPAQKSEIADAMQLGVRR